ncbi:DUF4291 domain-containing protein [Lysobacter yananisis]|uniref:DUF4291 domain-containing protein n=1 Tax=Lysobacter yananisis TaxID=1003114 RepID=A0ABY9PGB7_9GAMM|nr:DUF4291 domain-containing protein [Lysobacter yananisis]WMT05790.1 DUF4291 domain-containing protein [Lysobacter yananisis]
MGAGRDAAAQTASGVPYRQIRAVYDDATIRVYQAFNDPIADAALAAGRFVAPFSRSRMTWIKPSFRWMLYRAGWGFKDDNQRRILAIDIAREGFEWALANSCSSHPDPAMTPAQWQRHRDATPVRIQWDPERNLRLEPLDHRSIQIGLGRPAVLRYVQEWTQRIEDVTPLAHRVHELVQADRLDEAAALLPAERPYVPKTEV